MKNTIKFILLFCFALFSFFKSFSQSEKPVLEVLGSGENKCLVIFNENKTLCDTILFLNTDSEIIDRKFNNNYTAFGYIVRMGETYLYFLNKYSKKNQQWTYVSNDYLNNYSLVQNEYKLTEHNMLEYKTKIKGKIRIVKVKLGQNSPLLPKDFYD